MAYWIGVVGSRDGVDRLRSQDETWWCAPKEAAPGDLLAIYIARNRLKELPEEEGGISAIFEIVGQAPERTEDCRSYRTGVGAVPVPIKIIAKQRFPVSLRLAEMKADSFLAKAAFVRRSFQGTCFPASNSQFQYIRQLLTRKAGVGSKQVGKP